MKTVPHLPGTPDPAPREYELRHRALARKAAAEGIVLLKNNGALPLKPEKPLALFGMGAVATVKGGSGSGDVNVRDSVTIAEGLSRRGFRILNSDWLQSCRQVYDRARSQWKQKLWDQVGAGEYGSVVEAYFHAGFSAPPCPPLPEPCCDTAVYVVCRIAGEGKDRELAPGDYLLSQSEIDDLSALVRDYAHVVLILNAGGIVDLSPLDRLTGIDAIAAISQPGMEGGNAVADVLCGAVCPSGRLTDSWPLRPQDHPCLTDRNRSQLSRGQVEYFEDIYVGYRYFDTCQIPVRYGFGFGLSYTSFRICQEDLRWDRAAQALVCTVRVTNTGAVSGREVVQLYVTCPDHLLAKEFRRLGDFAKTPELAPGESCRISLCCPVSRLTSYLEAEGGYFLEAGNYHLWVGNSLESSVHTGAARMEQPLLFRACTPLWPRVSIADPIQVPSDSRRQQLDLELSSGQLPILPVSPEPISPAADTAPAEACRKLAEGLSDEELIGLCVGHNWNTDGYLQLGSSGIRVPGSAGETSAVGSAPSMILADGPAGLRLVREYRVKNGLPQAVPGDWSVENGYLSREEAPGDGERYYQYCTAFPVGTALAQTWDRQLLTQVGRAAGEEMKLFSVHLWLAPGMNIHRDPLCGRNFEYYSEDPLLTGLMAAAIAEGVQSCPGCGVTLKHFACNSQETVRSDSNSIVSERALREIYLRGFEIAVKTAQPAAIMTSYNQVNGTFSANSRSLCTEIARTEWGFRGLIMTDWGTTLSQGCSPAACIRAGNDLLMPGSREEFLDILQALRDGTLSREQLELCAGRILCAAFSLSGNSGKE